MIHFRFYPDYSKMEDVDTGSTVFLRHYYEPATGTDGWEVSYDHQPFQPFEMTVDWHKGITVLTMQLLVEHLADKDLAEREKHDAGA